MFPLPDFKLRLRCERRSMLDAGIDRSYERVIYLSPFPSSFALVSSRALFLFFFFFFLFLPLSFSFFRSSLFPFSFSFFISSSIVRTVQNSFTATGAFSSFYLARRPRRWKERSWNLASGTKNERFVKKVIKSKLPFRERLFSLYTDTLLPFNQPRILNHVRILKTLHPRRSRTKVIFLVLSRQFPIFIDENSSTRGAMFRKRQRLYRPAYGSGAKSIRTAGIGHWVNSAR